MMSILVLLVLAGYGWYVLTPDERVRIGQRLWHVAKPAGRLVLSRGPEWQALDGWLRSRTRFPLVTMALAAAAVGVFVLMLAAPGPVSDPATLVAWGASVGPRTGNGEWSRLVTSIFVHTGPLHLLVNVIALVQVGAILERMVGHVAFMAVYVMAGALAGVVGLYADAVTLSAGASGAVAGLYGLLLTSCLWGLLRPAADTIPLSSLKTLAPVAVAFTLYNGLETSLPRAAEWAGFALGLTAGAVLARDVWVRKPAARRVAVATAIAMLAVAASTVPLRGITDVRPELQRLVELESRTAAAYEHAVSQFRLGALGHEQLASLIDGRIAPELQSAGIRIGGLTGVPAEHRPLVAQAREFVRLREESWHIRSKALHKADLRALARADRSERAALEALDGIRTALAAGERPAP